MIKLRMLTIIVVLGLFLMSFGGSGQTHLVAAESDTPPTLSSEGYQSGTDSDLSSIASINATNTVLYDNGPLVTHPGGGYSGADASVVQTNLGLSIAGFPCNPPVYRVADDFEVTNPAGWKVDSLTLFAYQYGTHAYPPVSTMTGAYLQIWNGVPGAPGSEVIFGDLVSNRMTSASWTGIYRVFDTDLPNQLRPIMKIEAQVGIELLAGTYWLDWAITGSLVNGPSTPLISVLGQTITGNALVTYNAGVSWQDATDTGIPTQPKQGLPFVVHGSLSTWLWDQSVSTVNLLAYLNQEIPDNPTQSSYEADDFIVQKPWMVRSIFVPGRGWEVFSWLMNATQLNWKIYANYNDIPVGDPSGGGSAPIWSLSLPPTSSHVTITNGIGGLPSDTLLSMPTPLILPPGQYWLVFYPTMSLLGGRFGRQAADTSNGYTAQFINPGGYFGVGSNWQDWTVMFDITQHDVAFSIGGSWISEIFLPLILR